MFQTAPTAVTSWVDGSLIWVVVACGALGSWYLFRKLRPRQGGGTDFTPRATAGSIGVFVVTAVAGVKHWRSRCPRLVPVCCCLVVTAWSVHRLQDELQHGRAGTQDPLPGEQIEVRDHIGLTDQGHTVRLFHWEVDADELQQYLDVTPPPLVTKTIERSTPGEQTNCHGWVFTDGRFWILGDGVDQILRDNGYRQVTDPQAGDLVIYRAENAFVVHTAFVQGVLQDGTVLVESKWGFGNRFLHMVDDQPYSPHYAYYRSPRAGHLLTIVPNSPECLPGQGCPPIRSPAATLGAAG